MASARGGVGAADEIPEVEMEIMERPLDGLWRVRSKRVRDSLDGKGSHGFCGVTTSEKKAAISNHMDMNSDGTSKIGGRYLHCTHRERTLPDFNTLRWSISSPGENLVNKIKRPTKICPFYTQGRCNKGNGCTFLHEMEGPGSDYGWNNEKKAGLLATDAYGISRGSEEGSQVQCLSNLKMPQFKDSDGLSKDRLYRSLIHVYGETDKIVHGADKQSTFTAGVSQGISSRFDDTLIKKFTTPIKKLVPSPVVFEKNQEHSIGHHSGLTSETYLNSRDTFPRLLDGEILQSAAVEGTYLHQNYSDSKLQYRSFDLSIPSDPLQRNDKLSAYGGAAELSAYGGAAGNLPNTHHKENLSIHSPYSDSVPYFRNPLYDTSDHSFHSPTLHATSHLGRLSQHLSSPVIEKVGPHKYVDVGTGTSRPALVASSSLQPSIVSLGSLSPIKDEVWVTSVPFVPSFDFPDIKTPPRRQYDPFVDYIDSPMDDYKNNMKSSSISSQHTNPYVLTPKSLKHDGELARNMSAKGSDELARFSAYDTGRSSGMDDNDRVKVDERKPNAASNNEKTRKFRCCLAEHVKELIAPMWKEGYLSKDAHKLVVKKSIDKVLSSIEPHQVPTSEEGITNYITVSKSKIERLVKAYVDMHRASELQSSRC